MDGIASRAQFDNPAKACSLVDSLTLTEEHAHHILMSPSFLALPPFGILAGAGSR